MRVWLEVWDARALVASLTSCVAVCSSSFEMSMVQMSISTEFLLMSIVALSSLEQLAKRWIWSMSADCMDSRGASMEGAGGGGGWRSLQEQLNDDGY